MNPIRTEILSAAAGLMVGAVALALGASVPTALALTLLAAALGLLARETRRRRALDSALGALARAATDGGEVEVANPDARVVADALVRLRAAAAADRERLNDMAARAFRAQENERLRIASELQEETAQTLAGLLIRLRVARRAADEGLREQVMEELRSGLAEATDSVRRYARGLFPPALEDLGVVAAIEAYAMALADPVRPPIIVAAEEVRGVLARDGELALYRAVQEALGNAVRHADASSIRVDLTRHRGGVRAVVRDDGLGFDEAERAARGPCLGLLAMRERALFAGGGAQVTSRPGAGTRVVIDIPGIERRPAVPPPLFPPMPRHDRGAR